MYVYSAIDNTTVNRIHEILVKDNIKANNLVSFIEVGKKDITPVKNISNNLLIDSGAFTMFNNPSKLKNLKDYVDNYKNFIKKNDDDVITGYFELDIGKFIPYSDVKEIRHNLEEVTDKIIPVWHNYLGVEEFKKMCKDYNYISIGGVASKEISVDKLIPFIKYAFNHNVKLHILGMTRPKMLNKYYFYSCDSTNWCVARFGRVYLFKDGKQSYKQLDSKYVTDYRYKVDYLSYINFKRFQEHYYNYWKLRGCC